MVEAAFVTYCPIPPIYPSYPRHLGQGDVDYKVEDYNFVVFHQKTRWTSTSTKQL